MVRRILFVDDDEILQLVVAKGLASYADTFDVVLANDGFEALKKLENIAVSLIVIDLQMPRMDGLSMLSHILETYPDIPVIFISATPKAAVPYLEEMRGVLAYLEKPFRLDSLAKLIQYTLQGEASGGAIAAVSPTMFLQLMEMEGKTCTIRILDNDSTEGGILYLQDGRLLDARVGILKGIEGAYKIFRWDEVSVYFRNECPEIENRVNSDLQAVIMGALAARDEDDDSPFGDSEGSIAGFAGDLEPADNALSSPSPGAIGGEEWSGDSRQQSGNPACDRIRELLQREVGNLDWVHEVYHDVRLDAMMTLLSSLGEQARFGALRVGHIDNGEKHDRLLVPDFSSRQAVVVQVDHEAPLATVMDVLRFRE